MSTNPTGVVDMWPLAEVFPVGANKSPMINPTLCPEFLVNPNEIPDHGRSVDLYSNSACFVLTTGDHKA
ncbi:MAG: hypothetical protein AAF078_03965, partial [Planctomycetota bacterium]